MSSDLTNERAEQTRPDAETDLDVWWRIPPSIAEAQEAFHRDLRELLKTHYRQWVAYHGRAGRVWAD